MSSFSDLFIMLFFRNDLLLPIDWLGLRALDNPGATCLGSSFICSMHLKQTASMALFTLCSRVDTLVAPHNSQSPMLSLRFPNHGI